jgi:hypothetical protein
MITGLTLLFALAILGWGFYRALPMGKLGVVAWAQSAALMVPWLLLFALLSVGVQVNLAVILATLVFAVSVYVGLGRWLRHLAAQLPSAASATAKLSETSDENKSGDNESGANDKNDGVPTPSLVTLVEPTPVPEADVQAIRNIFGINTFFATEIIPYQDGLICKGNLRGESEPVHAQLTKSLETQLPDKYRLFLVQDQAAKPVVIILPRTSDPKPTTPLQWGIAILLLVTTLLTCLETSALLRGFHFYEQPQRLVEVWPIPVSLVAVLFAHEIGHWWMARQYQVRLAPPVFLPTWQLGSFGALTRFETLLPNRKALFDISLAGPAAGGGVALGILLLGFALSPSEGQFQLPSLFFQGSILVGSLARAVLGEALQQDMVSVHPFVLGGWLGLVVTALNLMPAGLLDGGRMIQAVYGRKIASWSTLITLAVLGVTALVNLLALYWAVVILVLQRNLERPSLEEITEVDDNRATWALLALFLMAATLIPLAPGLAGRLGIGVG